MKDSSPSPNFSIIEVWNSNLEEEFKKIRKIVQKYPYIAMVSKHFKTVVLTRSQPEFIRCLLITFEGY